MLVRYCKFSILATLSLLILLEWGNVLAGPDDIAKKQLTEVNLKQSTLAIMAQHLLKEEDLLRRDFANIALLTMLRAYVTELDAVRITANRNNKKLMRWYQATRDYIERISAVQQSVELGLPFSLTVTREGWVLVIAAGQPMLISGPKATDSKISNLVKTEYCQYHDCSWLKPEELVFAEKAGSKIERQEAWLFQQKRPPTFEIDRQFQFVFNSFSQKKFKQAVSHKAVTEIKGFLFELQGAKLKGYFINWELMSQEVPAAGVDQTVFLNTGDLYLRMTLPLLAHLKIADWRNLMDWLKWSLTTNNVPLVIEDADSLLKAGRMQVHTESK